MDDDIQDLWHAPSKPKVMPSPPRREVMAPRPIAPPPRPSTTPILPVQVGNRVTVTRAGRDRTAIVRVVTDEYVSIDFDPPLPHPAPVGSYMSVRVHPRDITRIIPPPTGKKW